MQRGPASAPVLAIALLAACGRHRAPRPPEVASCAIDGTWSIAWTPEPMVPTTGWGLERTLELTIRPGTTEHTDVVDGGPGMQGDVHVQIDRDRCRVRAVYTVAFAFSDDAGDRDDHLALELRFRGETVELGGRYRVVDTSEDPVIDEHARVTGGVTRVATERP